VANLLGWRVCENERGYYFVYKNFGQQTGIGHWSAEYKDASSGRDFDFSGLSSMEEARQACEKHADRQANESRFKR
jgi:hypothetical protein